MGQQLVSYPQAPGLRRVSALPIILSPPLLLQVVADADMAGQGPKASMPTGDGAGLCSTTCLGTCRSSPRASTSSIRWIGTRVCVWGVGQGRGRLRRWRRGTEPTTERMSRGLLRPHQHFGACGENVTRLICQRYSGEFWPWSQMGLGSILAPPLSSCVTSPKSLELTDPPSSDL